jgi:hypothetical protein
VALEVRRLALDLTKATDEIGRAVDGARRSLQALHASAAEGGRHVEAAQSAVSLGVTALDHAAAAAAARRADDATLAESGTELTILTSAIRERAIGSAKGTGDLADRLATLDQSLSTAEGAAREIEQALTAATASVARANDVIGTMLTAAAAANPVAPLLAPKKARKKRAKHVRQVAPAVGAKA